MSEEQVSGRVTEPLKNQIQEASHPELPLEARMNVAHELLILRYPSLKKVAWVKDQVAGPNSPSVAEWRRPSKQYPDSAVILNPTKRMVTLPELMDKMSVSFAIIAERIGISFEELRAHPEIYVIFAFFHEMGHARHFFNKLVKESREVSDPIHAANILDRQEMNEQLDTLPAPGYSPSGLFELERKGLLHKYRLQFEEDFRKLGIESDDDLLSKQQIAYKNLPIERDADAFATHFIRIVWKDLGLDKIVGK